jgi:hypothetical protein
MISEKQSSFLGKIVPMDKSKKQNKKLNPNNGWKKQTRLHQRQGLSKPNKAHGHCFL